MKTSCIKLACITLMLALAAYFASITHTRNEQHPQTPQLRINWGLIEIPVDDQHSVIVNDRTLVPLRAVMEALGFEVEWNEQKQTATLKSEWHTAIIQIGSYEIIVNDNITPTDVPAQIMNNRTMVPVRVISEATGMRVQWDARNYTVYIFDFRTMQMEQLRQMPRLISPPIQTSIDGFELGLTPEELVQELDKRNVSIIVSEHQDWETIYEFVDSPMRDGRVYNLAGEFSFTFSTNTFHFYYTEKGFMESISVRTSQHRTSAGVGIGSSRSDVVAAHGNAYAVSPFFGNIIEYFDGEKYLYFAFDSQNVVYSWGIRQVSIFELHAGRFL